MKTFLRKNKKYLRGAGDNKGEKVFYFLLSFIITYGAAFISSNLARSSRESYKELIKPWFSPPPIVFPIVWGILYTMMAYAIYRIWRGVKDDQRNKKSVRLYLLGLFFNFLWSPLFFGLQLRFIAFIVLIMLWITILLTIIEFSKRDKISMYLFIPYFIWVTFAGVLNFAIWYLNA